MSVITKIVHSLPLSQDEAKLLLWTAPSRYKVHLIEKRSGRGKRTIAQPTAEIKILQRLMVDQYIVKLPVSDAATAYRKGLGIVDHARAHAGNAYLLKLDFENFFPSIRGVDFLRHLKKYSDVEGDDAKLLARLFFWRPRGQRDLLLSIGAPSSPAISNTLLFDFDNAVIRFCRERDVVYTRYADDMAFSTNVPHVLNEILRLVTELCGQLKYPKLTLNAEKTVFSSKKHNRRLTGLVLTNGGKASLGRERKRSLRSMAAHYAKGDLPSDEHGKLRGWIAFSMSVDDLFVKSIERMIGSECFSRLMKG